MTAIPEHQQIGPAGHEQFLAYRPACAQLSALLNADGMAEYFVTMPDGSRYTLATIDPGTPAPLVWLDAAGICKTGGDIVPILSPEAAAVAQTGRLTLTPAYLPPTNIPWLPVVLIAAAITLGVALAAYLLLQGGSDEN